MKIIKRIIVSLISICIVSGAVYTPVHASGLDDIKVIGESAISSLFSAEGAYEYSVISRMAGRCGAATETGAKGVVFEIVYTDKKNIENALKVTQEALKTQFTKCPNATTIDLVTLDNAGKVVERIQCKDTPSVSATSQVIKAVEDGKYSSAQLVGTTESAAAFNAKAAEKGLSKAMIDSGISTETTEYIAQRSLGKIPEVTNILNKSKKSAVSYAAFAGGLAIADSVSRGDDLSTTAAHASVEAGEAAVVGGSSEIIAGSAGAILKAVGVSSAPVAITTFVISIGTVCIITYLVEGKIDKEHYEQMLAKCIDQGCAAVNTGINDLVLVVQDSGVIENAQEWASETKDKIADTYEAASERAGDLCNKAKYKTAETLANTKATICSVHIGKK